VLVGLGDSAGDSVVGEAILTGLVVLDLGGGFGTKSWLVV
jgi:hypothetical protein